MLTMGLTCVVGEQKTPLVCEGTAIPAKGDGEMHVSSETRCIEIVGDCHGEAKLIGKWKMAMVGRRLETELSLCEKDLAISFVANAIDGVRIRIQVKTGTTVESEYVVTVKEYRVC